jgi:hypothetical protein
MRRSARFARATLAPDTARRLIDAAAARGVQALSFTGGEPLLHLEEIARLVEHATAAGIRYVRTGTNGFLFMHSERADFERRVAVIAERLARTRLYTFWISLDSAVPAVHERMRGLPGVVAGIRKALPILHAHGIYPAANLGINRNTGGLAAAGFADTDSCREHFRAAFAAFFRTAAGLGFTTVNACYPMSGSAHPDGAVYRATSADAVVEFTAGERRAVFEALSDTVPAFRGSLRVFTPRSALAALIRQHGGDAAAAAPCRGGREFFFVDAQHGDTFPCGYRGAENLGKLWDLPARPARAAAPCRACDWECFRDPSELLSPLHDLFTRPRALLVRLARDRGWLRLWLEDVRYAAACGWFDGRRPPDYRRLAAFAA